MKLLYGSPIPEGAISVVIRPVFGRGNTQVLYKGPIEENGVVLDECKVSMAVAENAGFWSYIDSQKASGREVGTEDRGTFSWRLSIQYLDQSGAAALIGDKTSVVTNEAHEFYRNAPSDKKEAVDPLRVAQQALADVAAIYRDLPKHMAETVKSLSESITKELLKPLTDLSSHLVEMSKEETKRADEMTKAAMKGLIEAQPRPDIFDGMAKVAPAIPIVIKTIKDLVN